MATKPTRQQDQACHKLAQALLLIAEAARLDGRDSLGGAGWPEVARAVARASTAFGLEEIVSRALDERVRLLGLRSDAAELITLVEGDVEPLAALLLSDDDLRDAVARAEAELGEV
jgi:hypothetical protein